MSIQGIILLDLMALGLMVLIINLVRTRQLHVALGVIWLLAVISLIVIISVPGLLYGLPQLVGAQYPASALSLLAFLFIFFILIYFSVQITTLHNRQVRLIRELALKELLLEEAQQASSGSEQS